MSSSEESTSIVQLKVRLLGISPMIWRCVLVPASVSLCELHGILQVSMGWEGIHLCVVCPLLLCSPGTPARRLPQLFPCSRSL